MGALQDRKPWKPPPRPAWVAAVNRGDVLPITEEATLPLDRDGLLGEARARTALHDFGDEAFLEPFDILLPALEKEARLTVLGRWITRRFILRILEVRLHVHAYLAADPGVRDEQIVEPLFLTGAPRTGTTILFNLLAEDPSHRTPLGWELLRPVPPPDPSTMADDPRIALADRELRLPSLVVDGLDAIHEYGGRLPKECLSAMSFEFRSEEFTTRYDVPSYADWLFGCDMRPAYEMHKLVLQILQRRTGRKRWVLKTPIHVRSLDVVRAVYPDARIAVTHRDPLTVLGSLSSLVASLRYAHTDDVDMAAIGTFQADLWHDNLHRLTELERRRDIPSEQIHHSRYADFLVDPLGVVRSLYDAFGWELSADASAHMQAHLAARPQGRHGAHEYSFDDLGLDRAAEAARFSDYRDRFGVPDETSG